MTGSLPPELLAPEEREARAAELERRVAREWVRFAILDNVLLLGGLGLAGLLYAWAEAISWHAFVAMLIVLGGLIAGLTVYWAFRRVLPLQKEVAARRGER
jgi:membrane protein YdbS with pleckstrin-like domain